MVLWFKYSIVWKGTVPKQGTKNLVQPSALTHAFWYKFSRVAVRIHSWISLWANCQIPTSPYHTTSNWSDVGRRKFTLITPGRFSIKRRSLYVSRLSDVKFSIPYYISPISLSKGQSRPLPCLLTSGNAINLIARNTPTPTPREIKQTTATSTQTCWLHFSASSSLFFSGSWSATRESWARVRVDGPSPSHLSSCALLARIEEERLGTRQCMFKGDQERETTAAIHWPDSE